MKQDTSPELLDPNHPDLHPQYSTTDQIFTLTQDFFSDTVARMSEWLAVWHRTKMDPEKTAPPPGLEAWNYYSRYQGINLSSFRSECIRNNRVAYDLKAYKNQIATELDALWKEWTGDSKAAAQDRCEEFFNRCSRIGTQHIYSQQVFRDAIGKIVSTCKERQQAAEKLEALAQQLETAGILRENFPIVIQIAQFGTKDPTREKWWEDALWKLEDTDSSHSLMDKPEWAYWNLTNNSEDMMNVARKFLDNALNYYNSATSQLQQIDSEFESSYSLRDEFASLASYPDNNRSAGYGRSGFQPPNSDGNPQLVPGNMSGQNGIPPQESTRPLENPQPGTPQQPPPGSGTAANVDRPAYPMPMRPGDRVAYPQPPAGYQGP